MTVDANLEDCTEVLDYYGWHEILGDFWIVIPFLLGMVFYKLFDRMANGFPLKVGDALPDDVESCCSEGDLKNREKELATPDEDSVDTQKKL